MLHDSHEVEVGQTVYLFPHTKGASPACHRLLAVKVAQDPAKFWPYVIVEWVEGREARWERVHRDNIKKAPTAVKAADKRQGDSVGTGDGRMVAQKGQRRLAVGRPVANPDDQMELF